MVTRREIEYELRRRKRERNDEFLRLICDTSPEGKARLKQLLEEDRIEKEQHEKDLKAVADLHEQYQKQETEAERQAVENALRCKVLNRMGDYRRLYFYKKSMVIYDLTFAFCNRYINDYHDRTKDQMVQAARSGKQNFVEGLKDGQADFEQAMFLITIGQGSLQELLEDYGDYLRTRQLATWDSSHPRYQKMVEFCKYNNDIATYTPLFSKMNDEEIANMGLTLIHQTDFLIEGYLKKLETEFIALGGTKERMRRIRNTAKAKWRRNKEY